MIPTNPHRPRHATLGLAGDVRTLLSLAPAPGVDVRRRRALHWLGAGAASLAVAGCGEGAEAGTGTSAASGSTGSASDGVSGGTGSSGSGSNSSSPDGAASSGSSSTATADSCSTIPSETEGPYPGDGTNTASGRTVNALAISGIVRRDIRTSLSGAGTTAAGVPLTLTLKLVDAASSCAALANRAIYVWHCDRSGNYSLYGSGVADLDYLRGVQVTDAAGEVTFATIFPACYSGRWPHIHFEIYDTLTAALDGSRVGDYGKVSQLALPADVCRTVYQTASGYSASTANLARITLASDNVFGNDQAALQMATVTGSVADGYVATLRIGI